ncbi:hypothetical protein HanRHA438_Chr14g0668331 [Helianthus annuus]|uniref:Uncharacterized protein n=1 Tax=Helianthus annuus TaxID=4232 RepID=A0A9K3ECC5_HELAN|nr:hypothetical protein HanXRQr2_Chr14g0657431 [Helianthus annuus]KAJ0469939.1 hypothetical protein HanIR_Chr14g0713341 [Helianthus annuus]KAJ0841435.1 hypothetical protein HanPSC8_Chr14g0630301 [Helianthus annuus]KAJ0854969.1 hypothetical protein HanRHA438_Chr14g0668331 [Helianthus annuus]
MSFKFKPLFFICFLIFFHLSVSSLVYAKQSIPRSRFQPRRLMAHPSLMSLSTDPSKHKSAAMNESETSMEDSLRNRPPSKSNPSHN